VQRESIRVLHSFPHRLGKARICTTAWYEIESAAAAGATLTVLAADSVRPFETPVDVRTTLARGRLRVPSRLIGTLRQCALHDWLVARAVPRLADRLDIIHAWPLAALRTIEAAHKFGIPVALERCNAHTRFAYEVVREESRRLGVPLPPDHEHAFNEEILRREEQEYDAADALLCPSDFVVRTFRDQGVAAERLVRFIYGVDERHFRPMEPPTDVESGRPLTMLFAGVCAVRKGLHFALEAWLRSAASRRGKFRIAGDFLPAYRDFLASKLAHPSVEVLGHRSDIPELMRAADIFVLPSIEEGFGLVCTEAMASGCVPLVSDACTELCRHEHNALVHRVGDVATLTSHLDSLDADRALLARMRNNAIASRDQISWRAAGHSLVAAYRKVLSGSQ